MTYGYQQGGSFGSHKQAVGFDAGASERLRTEAAIKEKLRVEKERAKMLYQELERKFERNKTEISHKETEVRRLIAEITHAMREVQDAERQLKMVEEKEHSTRVHASDIGAQIQDAQKEELLKKKEIETWSRDLDHLENQINLLQQKANALKQRISEGESAVQKMTLRIKQLEGQEGKNATDITHARSEGQYKLKELDNKKRAVQAMDVKRMREIGEIQRLKAENAHVETEMKNYERALGKMSS